MKDFLSDANNEMIIANQDMVIGFSDLQHQEDILICQKGEVKEFPDRGVGLANYVNESEIDEMLSETRSEFEKDGMTVESINYNEETGELNYDANY